MSNGDDDSTEDAEPVEEVESADDDQADQAEGQEPVEEEPVEDEEPAEDAESAEGDQADQVEDADAVALDPEDFRTRLDQASETLEAAETEADLDEVAATLDSIESDLEAADLPEPDEDEDDPTELLTDRLSELRADLEEARGPYVEDVSDLVGTAAATIRDTRWTDDGEADAVEAARTFGETAREHLADPPAVEGSDPATAADELDQLADAIADVDLDPDADGETIAALLEAAETLEAAIEDAQAWADLTVREQLDEQGFYDVLTPENRKDFPPEWNAIKIYEQGHEPEPILTALDRFESDFMEENVLNALEHFAPEEAFDAMHELAQKRNHQPIRILGRIGDDRACETLHEFLGGGDVKLEKVTLRALGAIGSADSTQPVANRLVADNPEVRSLAARALGLIGDTRSIDPLERVLAEDDADEVRASAAWALNQIGTERALSVASEYADDRAYIVQVEAEKAAGA